MSAALRGEVVIIGGGAMGSSVACHLLSDPAFAGRVLVVEKDPTHSIPNRPVDRALKISKRRPKAD